MSSSSSSSSASAMNNFSGFPLPPPNPNYVPDQFFHPDLAMSSEIMMRNACLRQLEKERIREEIIAEEIMRRRELELEVRREMAMERELAIRRAEGIGLSGSSSFDGRLSASFPGRSEVGHFENLPFQRNPVGNTTSPPHVGKVVFLAKPVSSNMPVTNKKVSAVGESKLNVADPKKKAPNELGCALCKVSVPCGQALRDHLQGKKHQKKVAELKADRAANKRTGGPKLVEKKADGAFKHTNNTGNPKSNRGKNQWTCALCQVTATREEDLKNHFQGKNHKAKEAEQRANKTPVSHAIWLKKTDELEEKPMTEDGNKKQSSFCGEDSHVPSNTETGVASHQNHKAKEAELTANKTTGNHSGSLAIWQKKSDKQQEKPMTEDVDKKHFNILDEDSHVNCTSATDEPSHQDFKAKEAGQMANRTNSNCSGGSAIPQKKSDKQEEKPITEDVNSKQSYFWCEYCHVRCYTETDVTSHLKGKKHLAQLEAEKKNLATVGFLGTSITSVEGVISQHSYEEVLDSPVYNEAGTGATEALTVAFLGTNVTSEEGVSSEHTYKEVMENVDREANAVKEAEAEAKVLNSPIEKQAEMEATEALEKIIDKSIQQANNTGIPSPEFGNKWEEEMIPEDLTKRFKFWCELCQLGVHHENDIDSHQKGKKHMARLQAQKNSVSMGSFGASQNDGITSEKGNGSLRRCEEAMENANGKGEVLPLNEAEKEAIKALDSLENKETGGEATGALETKTDDKTIEHTYSTQVPSPEHWRKKEEKLPPEDLKKKFKFWCNDCQIGCHSEIVMGNHRKGRKHMVRLRARMESSLAIASAVASDDGGTCGKEDGREERFEEALENFEGEEIVWQRS